MELVAATCSLRVLLNTWVPSYLATKNNKSVLISWKKWEGKWNSNDGIEKMEGGFVLATAPTTLYFPTQKRKINPRIGVDENIITK